MSLRNLNLPKNYLRSIEPNTLEHLILRTSSDLEDEDIIFLPRNLKKLLFFGENLTNRSIKDLPPSLTYLDILDCDNITDDAVLYLPKTLLHFGIKSQKLTVKCIPHLPKSLTKLYTRELGISKNFDLTKSCIRQLPKHLHRLKSKSEKVISKLETFVANPNNPPLHDSYFSDFLTLPKLLVYLDVGLILFCFIFLIYFKIVRIYFI